MFYYRYRPATEVFLKELLYGEMYFCSPQECNDPFDSRAHFRFPPDAEKWKRLLELAWQRSALAGAPNRDVIDRVAGRLLDHCPLSFDDALGTHIVASLIGREGLAASGGLLRGLLDALDLYRPPTNYFVSFSRTGAEPLLWSHYADRHHGLCLIFRSIEGALAQDRTRLRREIRRSTPKGIARSIGHAVPASFPFEAIGYQPTVESLDAFDCFPDAVAERAFADDAARVRFCDERDRHHLQKHLSWGYEQEARIMLKPPLPWLAGQHHELSPQERLFHFEPSQLVGVALGARMAPEVRQRVSEIVEKRQEWLSQSLSRRGKTVVCDFVMLRAELSRRERMLDLVPQRLYGLGSVLDAAESDFPERYAQWKEGWALEFDGNRARKVQIA